MSCLNDLQSPVHLLNILELTHSIVKTNFTRILHRFEYRSVRLFRTVFNASAPKFGYLIMTNYFSIMTSMVLANCHIWYMPNRVDSYASWYQVTNSWWRIVKLVFWFGLYGILNMLRKVWILPRWWLQRVTKKTLVPVWGNFERGIFMPEKWYWGALRCPATLNGHLSGRLFWCANKNCSFYIKS